MPFQHKRLHEEPAPLSVVNPVYDEHAGDCESIELSNQGHSANNNVFKAPKSHTNGEVKLSIPETTSGPEHTSAEINATGDTHVQDVNSTNRVNDTAWHKGTEVPQPKLIQPAGHLSFGQHPLTRKIVVAVLAVILIVALALAGYFAYSLSTRQTKPSTTATPVISDQVHHQTNKTSKEYEFRLIGNDTGVGVLQVKRCKTWMYVCAEGWTSSSLVCQKLGYNGGDASLEVHTGYAELRAVKIGKLLNGPVDPCGRDVCMEVVGLRCVPLQRKHSNKGELIDNGNSSDTQTDVSMSTSVTQNSATDLKSTTPLAQSTAAHVPVSVLLPSATRTNAPTSSPRTNVPTTRTNEPTPTPSTDVVTSTTTTNVTTSTAKTNVVGSSTRTEDIASTPSNDVITSAIRTNVPTSTTRTNIVASTTITNVQAPTSRTNVLASTTKTNVLVPSTRSMVLESTTTHTIAAPPPEINIRLVGMVAVNVGRLEVEYAGVWGTVCDDLWGETDAQVVCRQLGFDNYTEYKIFPHPREITAAQRDQAVVMSEVNCTGSEMNLSLCSYELWREEDAAKCGHNEDVVLSCLPHATTTDPVPTTVPTTPSTTPTTTPTTTTTTSSTTTTTTTLPTTTAFSLLSDATAYIHPFKPEKPNKGLLVMQMNGTQYIMCDEDWSNKAAIVACRMTGYSEVLDENDNFYDEDDKLFDDGEFMAQFVMLPSIVNCIGSETSLTECEFKTLTDNCLHYEAVLGLECGPAPTPPTTVPTTTTPTTTISTTPTTTPSTTPTTSTTTPSTTTPTLPAVTTLDPKPIKDRIPIRLVGGDGDYVGRLEVLYNDTWGTVCNSIWTESNADVVCRQLQYPDVAETEIFAQRDGLSRGSDDETIWLKEIQCEGSEQHLTNCQHEIYTNGDVSCGHNQDVLMSCAVDATVTTTEKPEYHANGDLRLNPGPHIGRLEYYYGNQWGAVCDEGWDLADAQVACHQLGFSNVSAFEASTDNDLPDIPFVISGTNCIANETRLSNCPQNRVNLTSCVGKETLSLWDYWSPYNERIVIACDPDSKINTTEPRDRIRLVNGLEDVNIGMLQYKKEGVWGKLCNKPSFTNENADLACRQLGFPGVLIHNLNVSSVIGIQLSAFSAPYHGKGYNCNDEDAEIAECSSLEVATGCEDIKDEVAIECIPRSDQLEPSLADDSVRLVDGSSRFEGRVEVLINGSWGRVCDQGDWSDENMQYLCSHLFGDNYYTSNQLEIGEMASASGPFVAGGFNCTQQESLNEDAHFNLCSYNDSTEYLSLCDKDAVVRCIN